jgi:hypothetical protein
MCRALARAHLGPVHAGPLGFGLYIGRRGGGASDGRVSRILDGRHPLRGQVTPIA